MSIEIYIFRFQASIARTHLYPPTGVLSTISLNVCILSLSRLSKA
jgi:hypothetical protein